MAFGGPFVVNFYVLSLGYDQRGGNLVAASV